MEGEGVGCPDQPGSRGPSCHGLNLGVVHRGSGNSPPLSRCAIGGLGNSAREAVPVRVGPRSRHRRGDGTGNGGASVARHSCPKAGLCPHRGGLCYSPLRRSCVVAWPGGKAGEAAPANAGPPAHSCGGDSAGRGESPTGGLVSFLYGSGPESSSRGLSLLATSVSCSAVVRTKLR